MDCSTPGFPVLHYLPEFAQTHVHWVGDAIQPSHSLLPPSPPVFNLSQHQGLSQVVGSLYKMAEQLGASASASVLPVNFQGWFPLGLTSLISLLSKWLWRVFSNLAFVKWLRKCASDTIIWVLRQRIWGRGLFQKGPVESCSYSQIF